MNQENLATVPTLEPDQTDVLDMYPNGPAASYYPQAMFWTTHYGFLAAQPELTWSARGGPRRRGNVAASTSHLDYRRARCAARCAR